jgi:TPR repeat protein
MRKAGSLFCLSGLKGLLAFVPLISGQALASAPEIAHSAAHKFVITANGGAAWCGAKLHLRMVIQPDSPDIGHEDALVAIMHRMKAVVAANCPRATSAEITVVSAGKVLGKYAGDAPGDWSFVNISAKPNAVKVETVLPAPPQPAPVAELSPPPKPTTIDTLALSTYIPGLRNLEAVTLVADKDGNSYIGGSCGNAPVVIKLNAGGTRYAWVHVFAKSGNPCAQTNGPMNGPGGRVQALALDDDGAVIVAGGVFAAQAFPAVSAFRPPPAGNVGPEAFAARLSPDGQVQYATLIGGSDEDWGFIAAPDHAGGAWIAGTTKSSDFIRIGALYPAGNGGDNRADMDSFVVRLNKAGRPVFATPSINNTKTTVKAGASDVSGNFYLTGKTDYGWGDQWSPVPGRKDSFIAPPGEFGNTWHPSFILKLGSADNKVAYNALLLGEETKAIAVNPSGVVTVAGMYRPHSRARLDKAFPSDSTEMLVSNPNPHMNWIMPYVAQMKPDFSGYEFVSVFGPGNGDWQSDLRGLAQGPDGSLYVTGATCCGDTMPGPALLKSGNDGVNSQAYLVKLDSRGKPLWHTSLTSGGSQGLINDGNYGGQYTEAGLALTATADGVALIGQTAAEDLPTTQGVIGRDGAGVAGGAPAYQTVSDATGRHMVFTTGNQAKPFLMRLASSSESAPCRLSLNPSHVDVKNQPSGDSRFIVTTNRGDCHWVVSSSAPWVQVKPASGTGIGAVALSADTNIDQDRTAAISVALDTGDAAKLAVNQTAFVCNSFVTPSVFRVHGKAATILFPRVWTTPGCPWTVETGDSWATTSLAKFAGPGALAVSVSANGTGAERTTILHIAGHDIPIVQPAVDDPAGADVAGTCGDDGVTPGDWVGREAARGRMAAADGSPAEAKCWFEIAAAKGDTRAKTEIGLLYLNGLGVAPSASEAQKYLTETASGGDTEAMDALAALYGSGKLVPQDQATAQKWQQAANDLRAKLAPLCALPVVRNAMTELMSNSSHDLNAMGVTLLAAWFTDLLMTDGHFHVLDTAVVDSISTTGPLVCVTKFAHKAAATVIGGDEAAYNDARSRGLQDLAYGNYSSAVGAVNRMDSLSGDILARDLTGALFNNVLAKLPEIRSFTLTKVNDVTYKVTLDAAEGTFSQTYEQSVDVTQ